MMSCTERWLVAIRTHSQKFGWRLVMVVSLSFALLTFFFVYDESYLDSAMLMLDSRFAPLFASRRKVDDGATTAAGIMMPPLTIPSPGFSPSVPSSPPFPPPPLFAGCNIFDGKWVYDESYPLYTDCRFAERDFQCHRNGRHDRVYQKWRWQPHGCTIPRFDAHDMLARLNGLRVLVVGDSMGRTQWESLICLLLQAVPRKDSVVFVGGPITKQKRYIGARFKDHNISIDYYRSPHLVHQGSYVPKGSPTRVTSTLELQKIDDVVAKNFADADVLLLNTGHWWNVQKTYDVGRYFQMNGKVVLGMPVITAFKHALSTVTSWVDDHVNSGKTEVFFRSIEPSHWENPMAVQPYRNLSHLHDYPRATVLKEVVERMHSPATVLNVTFLSSYRPDAHVFTWTEHKVLDCSHWCLPGVPDTWNQLLYASLLSRGRGVWAATNRTGDDAKAS